MIIYSSTEERVEKEYRFVENGLNIILGVKNQTEDEGNGVGKSAMIQSINWLLGGSIAKKMEESYELIGKGIICILELIIKDKKFYLARSVADSKKGYIKEQGEIIYNLDNYIEMKDKQYKNYINDLMIEDEVGFSFASMREYIIRDEKSGFVDVILGNRSAWRGYQILNYLFGINCRAEEEIIGLKKQAEDLERELKVIEVLGKNIAEDRIQEQAIKRELEKLVEIGKKIDINESLDSVEKSYVAIKDKLNEVTSKMLELNRIKGQYQLNINELIEKTNEIKKLDDIEQFYIQLMNYFPNQLQHNYKEILNYYEQMVESRGGYFNKKIEEIDLRLNILVKQKEKLQKELDTNAQYLRASNVVEDIGNIIEQINTKNAELTEISGRIVTYNKKDEIAQDINEIKQQIMIKVKQHQEMLANQKDAMTKSKDRFAKIVGITYKESGLLDFEYNNKTGKKDSTGRIKIKSTIMDEQSHGRQYMKINMFDCTWLLQCVDNDANIDVLFHDGSYVKPDNKQAKFRLLKYMDDTLKGYGKGQYFVTLNLGELEDEDLAKLESSFVARLNKDSDKNRFMGVKY